MMRAADISKDPNRWKMEEVSKWLKVGLRQKLISRKPLL